MGVQTPILGPDGWSYPPRAPSRAQAEALLGKIVRAMLRVRPIRGEMVRLKRVPGKCPVPGCRNGWVHLPDGKGIRQCPVCDDIRLR